MGIRNIVAFTDAFDGSDHRLETAATLAEATNAHLVAVACVAHPGFHMGYQSVAGSEIYFQDVQRAQEEAHALSKAAHERLVRLGRSGDTRWGADTIAGLGEIAAIHTYYADLAIVGQPCGDAEPLRSAVLEGALIDSGRPLIVVPDDWGAKPMASTVVIGWSPCRAAARAVHDALAMMSGAQEVHIAVVDARTDERSYGDEPGADLATALARHGLNITVTQLPRGTGTVAEMLLSHAATLGADLLVTGGYGHSRLREALVGGVTRELLKASPIPLFMSH